MQIVLFDSPEDRIRLYPLTLTRPISYLRVGIMTIKEKWQLLFPEADISVCTDDYLIPKFGKPDMNREALWINAAFTPNPEFIEALNELSTGEALKSGDEILAFIGNSRYDVPTHGRSYQGAVTRIKRAWNLFEFNGDEIRKDFELITKGRKSESITDKHTICYGENIFLEEGASVKAAVLNAENGPIYIGKYAQVQEGALIRGPFALGDYSTVGMGAKMRGDITVGPHCKVAGEVSNSILMGYSNKGHDGYLGNSVVGEWCNLGAGTSGSNLKNNYSIVKVWDYENESFVSTGLQFCGLIMGDRSRSGINTMFNTGTTVGVAVNVFGSGFPPTHIPSFSWGGSDGFTVYQKDKAYETAEKVMKRRNLSFTEEDKAVLNHIFEHFSPE